MFENLFQYQSSTGLVVPDTSAVRDEVIVAMKQIFGDEFEYKAETTNGLFVDLLTKVIKDFTGVTAQNLSGMNIRTAIGVWLDALGELFGVARNDGEDDESYRQRLINASALGPGFVKSVYNAIYAAVDNIKDVCVLENGKGEVAVVPENECGVAIDPHSILIFANSNEVIKICNAIEMSLSAGCGFSNFSGHGSKQEYDTGNRTVSYFIPEERFVKVDMTVNPIAYTGTDIVADATSAIRSAISGKTICAITKKSDFEFAVAATGKAIIPIDTKIYVRDSEDTSWTEVEYLTVMAYQFVNPEHMTISITVEK